MNMVSVIIPAHNQGRYLGAAIQSALDQTYPRIEVIVVDDGSTDDTAAVAAGFADPRLRYLYQANRGLSAARNTGIQAAQGLYLSYLDSDDLFLPHKLALLVAELEDKPELGLVAGQAIPIDEAGRQIGEVFTRPFPTDSAQLLLGNPVHVGSILLRRSWQERVGFFDEGLRSYEDWDMWLRLARAGCEMGWVAQPVSLYRFHQAQMTRISSQMTTATFAVLDKIFSDPTLPDTWRAQQNLAYCHAHLRAAAQAFHSEDFDAAGRSLHKAIELQPSLLSNNGKPLADRFVGWTRLPKTADPLAYLATIYDHLPDGFETLHARRQHELGSVAMQLAFEAYQRGDLAAVRTRSRQAIIYQPTRLKDRGALKLLLHSHLPFLAGRTNPSVIQPGQRSDALVTDQA